MGKIHAITHYADTDAHAYALASEMSARFTPPSSVKIYTLYNPPSFAAYPNAAPVRVPHCLSVPDPTIVHILT